MTERRFVTLRLPLSLVASLDRIAAQEGVSRHRLGCLLLAAAISDLPDPGPEAPEA